MARTIKELPLGQIIYLNEKPSTTVSFVPYIYLGQDEIGNCIILRKYVVSSRRMNNVNIAEYIGCECDLWLNNMAGNLWKDVNKTDVTPVDYTTNGFLTRFDEATRNAFVRTEKKHYVLAEKETVTIDRECFLLSYTNLGYATTPNEGKSFLPALLAAYNTTAANTARIARNTSESAVVSWMSSEYSSAFFRFVNSNGTANNSTATYTVYYVRPALSVSPDTIVSEETEETIYLLPDGSTPYRELECVVEMGERETVPEQVVCRFDNDNCDEFKAYLTVNLHDETPQWVEVENNVPIDTSGMIAESGCCLGIKIYANSNGRAIVREPIILCV